MRGMSLKGLAEYVGVSRGYMTQVSRGERSMSPPVQARVETALDAPARVEPAQPRSVDPRALWDRMEAHGYTQNEVARLAGISSGHLSQIMNGQRNPSGEVLAKLHGVLFRPTAAELVVPAEVKVMAWKKGGRNGVVVRGAGGPGAGSNPGGGTVRIGGRVPWGAEVEYAYRAGYDSRGRVSVTHVVDERSCSVMLTKPGPGVGDPRCGRAGLLRDADETGPGRRLAQQLPDQQPDLYRIRARWARRRVGQRPPKFSESRSGPRSLGPSPWRGIPKPKPR